MRKTCWIIGVISQSRILPPVPSILRCNRINLLRNVLEIKLTSEKSTTSRIGLPSFGRASAI